MRIRVGWTKSVQSCRACKLRNLLSYLSKDDQAQVKSIFRAAWKLRVQKALNKSKSCCVASTNIIENRHGGVRIQRRRVTQGQNGEMVLRWKASTFLRTEKRFKRIMAHLDLWTLEAILNRAETASQKAA
jgi:hypothetical protein